MAKGDSKQTQNQINNQGKIMQTSQNALMNNLYGSNQQFQGNYNLGSGMDLNSYADIMGKYQGLYNGMYGPGGTGGGGGGGVGDYGDIYGRYANMANGGMFSFDPEFRGGLSKALSGYSNFADTGGFSAQDLQDLRARAISPTRSIYSNAQAEVERGKALTGFSPNAAAAQAKMARQMSAAIGDANINANASIAQMVQQGKLAGLGGLSSTSLGGQSAQSRIDELNANMMLQGLQGMQSVAGQSGAASRAAADQDFGNQMAILSGMRSLYGTTPGMSATFGDQVLNSNQQLLAGQGYQNQIGSGLIGSQFNKSQIPGNFQQGLGNVAGAINLGGRIAGGLVGGFGGLIPGFGSVPGGYYNTEGGG